jgi:hypothetical protein
MPFSLHPTHAWKNILRGAAVASGTFRINHRKIPHIRCWFCWSIGSVADLTVTALSCKKGRPKLLTCVIFRLLNVPIVFRLDSEGDGNNNKKLMKLFGHPNLIRLPNRIQGQDLYAAVDPLVPYVVPYSILLVDGQVGAKCLSWFPSLQPAECEKYTGNGMKDIYGTQTSKK